jgi:hypothetical protein
VKGISVRLDGDFDALEADPGKKRDYISRVRRKLGKVFEIAEATIIIFGITKGSNNIHCNVPSGVDVSPATVVPRLMEEFPGEYRGYAIHPAFSHLKINPETFAPRWNRDFRIPSNCPRGECRGGYPYKPPEGWQRFGMSVLGKFDGGDQWIGMSNVPGEWAVVYHGTKVGNVEGITETPLKAGCRNAYGYGIYCSPDPAVAVRFCDCFPGPQCSQNVQHRPQGSQNVQYKYMFVCRVNATAPHRCTENPCPKAILFQIAPF